MRLTLRDGMIAGGILLLSTWSAAADTCPGAASLRFRILRTIQRTSPGFTEGLIYRDGFLYESVGGYGSSGLRRIDPGTGDVAQLAELPARFFGEGLEASGGILRQLTWKENRVLSWSFDGTFLGEAFYPFEGWGLARAPGGGWVASDGSAVLHFLDGSWKPVRDVRVREGKDERPGLNELELGQGAIWANVFTRDRVLRIDPSTGCVGGELDLSELARASGAPPSRENVLNGIAFRPDHASYYLTGKNWPRIYEIAINPAAYGGRG